MKKFGILAGLLLAGAVLWAEPAVCEGEEVRIYTLVEFFSTDEAGNKGTSLGMPEMMEGGIKVKVLEVGKTEEQGSRKGNWCRIRLRLGMWMEDTSWIPKDTECWVFIFEDANVFRK